MLQPIQVALARVGVDVGLFEALVASNGSSSSDLAQRTKVDIVLLRKFGIYLVIPWMWLAYGGVERLLRYYQAAGMIVQLGADDFAPNNITKALAWDGGRAGICVQ